jgi:hypothetical protein
MRLLLDTPSRRFCHLHLSKALSDRASEANVNPDPVLELSTRKYEETILTKLTCLGIERGRAGQEAKEGGSSRRPQQWRRR